MTSKRDGFSIGRRTFLEHAGRAGLAALGAPALAAGWAAEAQGAASRSYAPGLYGLELDGTFVGYLSAFSGGSVTADLVTEQPGPDFIPRKHPGVVRVEPITIETALPMGKPFYEWIKLSIEPGSKFPRKSGAIIEYDSARREMGRRLFSSALVTEVEFPACDAASRDPARLTVTCAPETVRLSPAKAGPVPVPQKAAAWQRQSFRLSMQGFETTRVSRVEPFEVKVATSTAPVGRAQPSVIQVPNLVFTLADTSVGQFYAWLDDFLVRGNHGQDKERGATLDYLAPDLKSSLLTLTFYNLGILKVSPEAAAGGVPAGAIRRSKVEMYCEAMRADFRT